MEKGKKTKKPSTKNTTKKHSNNKAKAKIIHVKKEKENNFIIPFLIILFLVLAISFGAYYFLNDQNVDESKVLATVNGKAITQDYLDDVWASIPIETKAQTSREEILEELIEEQVLLNRAYELGINATEEEVESNLQMQMMYYGMNQTTFEAMLESQGSSIEDFKKLFQRQLTLIALFETEITNTINVTDQEVETYYNENIDQFVDPEKVTVKHILIPIDNNTDESQSLEKAQDVLSQFNEGADFCELVTNYSTDFASVANCGEFTFSEGYMVPEFNDASFEMEINETRIVKTEHGHHIILKTAYEEEKTMNLNDAVPEFGENATVKSVVQNYLIEEKAKSMYEDYVIALKEVAQIERLSEVNEITGAITQDSNIEEFAKCLTEKDVKMYGAFWCSYCNSQKEMFGDAVEYIQYVECDQNDENAKISECVEQEIEGFPTWVINGQKYSGKQSFERLAQLSGCEL